MYNENKRGTYALTSLLMNKNLLKSKRAQVTLFIIIAIVIVAAVVLIYMFFPQIKSGLGLGPLNPSAFIQTCLEDEIENNVETLSLQGGSLEPGNYILYQDQKIQYLCYTNEHYEPCVMQQPLLQQHIEEEIENSIRNDVEICFDSLKESFEGRGYIVDLNEGRTNVALLPERIVTNLDYEVVLTKESTEKYETFRVIIHNNLYELVGIANSILSWETRFGDAETTTYMDYYHDLDVKKKKQQDGSTVYSLLDRGDGSHFQFATRSYVWPPGYGIEE